MDWLGGKGGLEGGCVCLDSVCNDFFIIYFIFITALSGQSIAAWSWQDWQPLLGLDSELVHARDSSPVGRVLFVVRITNNNKIMTK